MGNNRDVQLRVPQYWPIKQSSDEAFSMSRPHRHWMQTWLTRRKRLPAGPWLRKTSGATRAVVSLRGHYCAGTTVVTTPYVVHLWGIEAVTALHQPVHEPGAEDRRYPRRRHDPHSWLTKLRSGNHHALLGRRGCFRSLFGKLKRRDKMGEIPCVKSAD
jgi:hypothetical protein